jgi:UDP:flavonoid glycosyltransferase YjiC (YdhE family)
MHSPLRLIAMFPEWFAPRQPDWPPQTRLIGFPLYSEEGVVEPSPEVVRFIDAGQPPLVFTPGSAYLFGHDFFAAAADACGRLGQRGLLLTRFPEQVPANLPADVRHVDFAVADRCRSLAARLADAEGLDRGCDAIEEAWAARRG